MDTSTPITVTPASANAFLQAVDLTGVALPAPTRRSLAEAGTTSTVATPVAGSNAVGLGVQTGIDQAFLVGGQIVSFNAAVTEERRAAALNSCLLAQLQATKLHGTPSTPDHVFEWHAAVINTLTNIGWALQSGVRTGQSNEAEGVSVDKVLFDILSSLLGNASAVATMVQKVFDAISNASKSDPFITLYSKRVVQQSILDFGAALGNAAADGFILSVVECVVDVRSDASQVLFFKWQSDSASVDGRRYDLALSDAVWTQIRPQVEGMLANNASSYISQINL